MHACMHHEEPTTKHPHCAYAVLAMPLHVQAAVTQAAWTYVINNCGFCRENRNDKTKKGFYYLWVTLRWWQKKRNPRNSLSDLSLYSWYYLFRVFCQISYFLWAFCLYWRQKSRESRGKIHSMGLQVRVTCSTHKLTNTRGWQLN